VSDLQVDLTVAVRVVVRRADDDLIPDCRWGSSRYCPKGVASRTMSPKVAASETVAARALAPGSLIRSVSDSGPRELLMATSWPASVNRRAAVLLMLPDPIVFSSVAVRNSREQTRVPSSEAVFR
jgi:hypothetical protein